MSDSSCPVEDRGLKVQYKDSTAEGTFEFFSPLMTIISYHVRYFKSPPRRAYLFELSKVVLKWTKRWYLPILF